MSGMEPMLIGAALGAGASGLTGGNPLQGAMLGAAGGGIGKTLAGMGAASQTAGNVAAAAGTETARQAATLIPPSGMSSAIGIGGSTPYMVSPGLGTVGAGVKAAVADPSAFGAALMGGRGGGAQLGQMAAMQGLMGSMPQQQQPPQLSAAPIRPGQPPRVTQDELMLMQMMQQQRQRRPISLL